MSQLEEIIGDFERGFKVTSDVPRHCVIFLDEFERRLSSASRESPNKKKKTTFRNHSYLSRAWASEPSDGPAALHTAQQLSGLISVS